MSLPLEGFAGFKFGASIEDLKKRFKGLVDVTEQEPVVYRRFASPDGNGRTIELFFHNNSLFMGRILYRNISRNDIKRTIEQEFGPVFEQTELGDVWDYSTDLGISLTKGETEFDCLYYVRREFYPYLDEVKKANKRKGALK